MNEHATNNMNVYFFRDDSKRPQPACHKQAVPI